MIRSFEQIQILYSRFPRISASIRPLTYFISVLRIHVKIQQQLVLKSLIKSEAFVSSC